MKTQEIITAIATLAIVTFVGGVCVIIALIACGLSITFY